MSLVNRLLHAGPAWTTHHHIALDALGLLKCDSSWRRMFLRYSDRLLAGATTPEDDFGDYKNHVLFVRDSNWGGAAAAARAWYLRTVYALRDQLWSEAAFSAGVLCHYVVDPMLPLHTGQSESAGAVRYGLDLAIERDYVRLTRLLSSQLGGYPVIETPNGKDWIERLMKQGVEQAHADYDLLIDHCEPHLLLHRPYEGMDEVVRKCSAKCLGMTTAILACVLDRAILESGASIPNVQLFGVGLSLLFRAPFAWLTGPMARMGKRAVLHKMVREYEETGKVVKHLAVAESELRRLHAVEVRRITLEQLDAESVRPAGSKHPRALAAKATVRQEPIAVASSPQAKIAADSLKPPKLVETRPTTEPIRSERPTRPAAPPVKLEPEPILSPPAAPKMNIPLPPPSPKPVPPPPPPVPFSKLLETEPVTGKLRFNVSMSSPVADAPGITPQLAEQLVEMGVESVGDLLTVDPKVVVDEIKSSNVTTDKVIDWQSAAALACQLPEIRANDVLLLISAGVHDPRQLSRFAPKELLDRLQPFLKSTDSPDLIRLDPPPTLRDASQWVELAKKARPLAAAA